MNPDESLWCDRGMVVSVRGPDSKPITTTQVAKPFARVGSHPSSDVVVSTTKFPSRAVYLHATDDGLYFVRMDGGQEKRSVTHGWLPADGVIRFGKYSLTARLSDGRAPALPPPTDLRERSIAADDAPLLTLRCVELEGPAIEHLCRTPLTIIGRTKPTTIRLNRPLVSRRHCILFWSNRSLWAIDLHSANGTQIGGKSIDCAKLSIGQVLQVGGVQLAYRGIGARELGTIEETTDVHAMASRKGGNASTLNRSQADAVFEFLGDDALASPGASSIQHTKILKGAIQPSLIAELPEPLLAKEFDAEDQRSALLDLQVQLAELQLQRDALQSERDSLQVERDKHRAARDELRAEQEDLLHQTKSYSKQLQALEQQERRRAAELIDIQQRRDELQVERDKLRIERDNLRNQRETAQAERDELLQQTATVSQRLETLNQQERRSASQSREVQQQRDKLQAQRDELLNQTRAVSKRLEDLGSQEQKNSTALVDLQRQRDELQSQRDKLQLERDALRVERDELKVEHDELLGQTHSLSLRLEELGRLEQQNFAALADLQSQRDAIQAQRDELQCERDALEAQRDELQTERDELQVERDHLLQESHTIVERIAQLKLHEQRGAAALLDLRKQQDDLQGHRDEFQVQRDELVHQARAASKQLEELNLQEQRSAAALLELQQQRNALSAQRDELLAHREELLRQPQPISNSIEAASNDAEAEHWQAASERASQQIAQLQDSLSKLQRTSQAEVRRLRKRYRRLQEQAREKEALSDVLSLRVPIERRLMPAQSGPQSPAGTATATLLAPSPVIALPKSPQPTTPAVSTTAKRDPLPAWNPLDPLASTEDDFIDRLMDYQVKTRFARRKKIVLIGLASGIVALLITAVIWSWDGSLMGQLLHGS